MATSETRSTIATASLPQKEWRAHFTHVGMRESPEDWKKYSVDLLGEHLKLPSDCHLIPAIAADRACDTEKGVAVYWKTARCGVRFPLTNFQKEILNHLRSPIGQMSATIWCFLNSFEHLMTVTAPELNFLPLPLSVSAFGYFFQFRPDKDFWTVSQQTRIRLLKKESKIDDWDSRFAFIPVDFVESQGIPISWNPDLNSEEEKKRVNNFPPLSREDEEKAKSWIELVSKKGVFNLAFRGVTTLPSRIAHEKEEKITGHGSRDSGDGRKVKNKDKGKNVKVDSTTTVPVSNPRKLKRKKSKSDVEKNSVSFAPPEENPKRKRLRKVISTPAPSIIEGC